MKNDKNKKERIFMLMSLATGTKEEVLKNPNGGIYWDSEQEKYMEVFTPQRLEMYNKAFSIPPQK